MNTLSKISNDFLHSTLIGLSKKQKETQPKFFYDYRGSELFEEITQLDSYYQTRTEISILKSLGNDIEKLVGKHAAVVEFGAGSSRKIPLLLQALHTPSYYIPIDIAGEYLVEMSARLHQEFPLMQIAPIAADFMQPIALPKLPIETPILGFLAGSTIGNLSEEEAIHFLSHTRKTLGDKGQFLIGIDRVKSPEILIQAYNDPEGITAQFNLNLLVRANKELEADFDLTSFQHQAIWNPTKNRIEMHLVSTKAQKVTISGKEFYFNPGETIHTENSQKYTLESFTTLAKLGGWNIRQTWTDKKSYFSIVLLKSRNCKIDV